MSASGESSTTMHRLLHASGSHPIPTPYDPKTNQYNQDLGLIHSKKGNHLESPKEGSSIDHQVTIYLHAQNITMLPTNETWPEQNLKVKFSRHNYAGDSPDGGRRQYSVRRMAARCRAKRGVFKLHRAPSHGAPPLPTRNILRASSSVRRPASNNRAASARSQGGHHWRNAARLLPIIAQPVRIILWAVADQRVAVAWPSCATSRGRVRAIYSIGYPRMSASGESSTTMHRLLHASGSQPIPPPNDPKTNQYNQDLGLIHSTNGNHLESPNEGSSIDHQASCGCVVGRQNCAGRDLLRLFEKFVGKIRLEGYAAGRAADTARGAPGSG
ncbi:putative LRR receptor-like serine/threonine-protein kinase [Dorcoceras hygrometricum]|uniref:Putative LRR receptor-like serine/threonine-protein kinase n=1 Tax=Dorcoceras hygrometricum TaxID=472368 RepID=A0A2Z7D247_9LAMI|nr:putative LRR receptor-like serine/threonine-protein kinase [Dorcoceras hygrometricum]